jgi:hypothetical protein
MLTECAWAAARSRDSYLSAQFWRLARRIGKQEAAVAVGHSILVIAWHLLTNDCDYADLGGDYFVRRDADRARQRAVAQLQASATRSPSNPSPHDGDSPFRMRSARHGTSVSWWPSRCSQAFISRWLGSARSRHQGW